MAVGGAAIGAVSGAAGALSSPNASATSVLTAAGIGLVAGGLAGIDAGIVATVAIGAGAGAAATGEWLGQVAAGQAVNWDAVGTVGFMGGWAAGSSWGLLKLGVSTGVALGLPTSMTTIMYPRVANAGTASMGACH